MTKVNMPQQLKMPQAFLSDIRKRYGEQAVKYFSDRDFIQWQLWRRTGGADGGAIDGAIDPAGMQAQINLINERLGSGEPLTSDETGFTVDLNTLSVDMTEA